MNASADARSGIGSEFLRSLRTELAWNGGRAIDAMKVGLACVIGFLFAEYRELVNPYWVLVTILMVSQPSYGSVVEKIAMRAIATIVGMGLVVVFTVLFPQNHAALSACSAALIFVSALGSRGSWRPQAFMMASAYVGGITCIALTTPQQIPDFFYERCVDIAAGSLLVLLIFRYFAPRFASRQLEDEFQRFCNSAAAVIEEEKAGEVRKSVAAVNSMSTLLQQSTLEGEVQTYSSITWKKLLSHAQSITGRLALLTADSSATVPDRLKEIFGPIMHRWRTQLGPAMREVGNSIRSGATPAVPEFTAKEEFERQLASVRAGPGWPDVSNLRLLRFENVAAQLSGLSEDIRKIYAAVADQAGKSSDSSFVPALKAFPLSAVTVAHACKVVLCIGVVIWLGLIFRWEQMVSVVFSAALIIQSTHGGSVRKATLRLAGCVLGGVAAFLTVIFVIPSVDDWWQFAPTLFMVVVLFEYIGLGSPRYNYAGQQAGLCFAIVMFNSYHPNVDLTPVGERVGAILVGGTVALLLTRYVFPERASDTVRSAILQAIAAVRQVIQLGFLDSKLDPAARTRLLALREKLRQMSATILEARAETSARVLHNPELLSFAGALEEIALFSAGISAEKIPSPLLEKVRTAIDSLACALDCRLGNIVTEMEKGEVADSTEEIERSLQMLDSALHELREARTSRAFNAESAMAFFSWIEQVRTIAKLVGKIGSVPRLGELQ